MMKLTFVIMITAFLQLSLAANAQKITLNEKATPLEQVLKKIRLKTGYNVIWNQSLIEKVGLITIKADNDDLNKVMTEILDSHGLSFVVKNKTIVLQRKAETATKVSIHNVVVDIRGKVVDEKGLPLPGVTVRLKQTDKFAITDSDGNYAIKADAAEGVLVFSYLGFISIEEQISGRKVVNVTLKEEVGQLQDVVVTALGISKETRKVGYNVTTVDGSLLNQAKEPNVANSLTGRIAGLNVSGVSSGPGSSARILLRGVSGINTSGSPLIVIDGVPMDNTQRGSAGVYGGQDMGDGISSINPDDIETVTVLNGSAASALYGTRSSNGVILITTKSGKGQKGIGVEYSGNFSLNSIVDNKDYQKAYGQGLDGKIPKSQSELVAASLNAWGAKLTGEKSLAQNGDSTAAYSAVENQLNKFYRDGAVITNTLAMLGGWDKGNIRFSLSQNNNQSVMPNSGLKRYSGIVNLNQELIKNLKLTAMVNYINEDVKLRPNLGDMSRNPNFTMGLLPANVDPDYLKTIYDPITGYENHLGNGGYVPNPWFVVEKVTSNTSRKRIISSTALRYDFTKELYLQTRLGYDYTADNVLKIEPTGIGYKPNGALEDLSNSKTTEMNIDVLAGYSKKIIPDLSFDLAVGGNIRKFNYEKIGVSGSQWKIPNFYTVSNLTTSTPIYVIGRSQTNSAYYTVDFNYKNFLTLTNTGRYDRFSTANEGIFTPSVSGSFIFSNLVEIPNLSFGKIRLAFAETSGEPAAFRNAKYYNLGEGTFDGNTFANLDGTISAGYLAPFNMQEFEVGMELKGLKGRIGLNASYFARKTYDELVLQQISQASGGYSSAYIPLGSTQNRGFEFSLNGTPIKQSNFSWDASFNFSIINNKLLKIDGETDMIQNSGEGQYRPTVGPYSNGAGVFGVVGLPLAQIMAYDYKYDANGNIIVDVNGIPLKGAFTPMGSGLPKYYGGLNNNFKYKSFNLSFLLDYRFGVKVLSATDFLSVYYGLNKKTLEGRETGIVVKGVKEDGTPNDIVATAQNYYPNLVRNVSATTVYDGSFIKLRQVTLGYNLPQSIFKASPVAGVNVSFAARNLLTLLSHTKNFDPEDSFSSAAGNAGLEGAGLPATRTYGISLNIKLK